MPRAFVQSGSPSPLGATPDGGGTNFAVFSAHATAIDVCLFDRAGRRELARHRLPERTDEVWHGYVPRVGPGDVYGLRAEGPYDPENGHRFNPHKLLLDPYAKQLVGHLRWTDALYGYRVGSPRADLSFDRRDSAPAMPKARIVEIPALRTTARPVRVPWPRTVIYEAHVRGLTRQLEHVPEHERGTFRALGDPFVVEHLSRLGVTTVELLPIHAFVHDRRLAERQLRNYWGYNTLSFFAPEPAYLADDDIRELRGAIEVLHRAGIEVVLDVVYNHTAEGSELGPTLSFRGLDNASYYRLAADAPRRCIDDTGTGNTFNSEHPRVIQLIADSLRYWVEVFDVDGFRFDLGVSLGRERGAFDEGAGFFDVLRQDPLLAHVKLISEPWDLGPDGYQLGAHPPGLAEWNGRYRDDVRRFWRGDAGQRGVLARGLQGSTDLFDRRGRRPWSSVNFITAHDGFTLQDLVSYNDKHNEANGEDNRDGHDDNASCNWGAEGATDDAGILAQRGRVRRALLATLFFSQGTPMLLGGDEMLRSQDGNNNAYCQDNPISWFDWTLARTPAAREQVDFVRSLAALRRRHPTLACDHFQHGLQQALPGVGEIAWFDESGQPMTQADWGYAEGRLLAVRRAGRAEDGGSEATLLLINGSHEERAFRLPAPAFAWRLELDSADPARREAQIGDSVSVAAHGVVLLAAVVSDAEAESRA